MKQFVRSVLTAASLLAATPFATAGFADFVASYVPGSGTAPGHTDPGTAVGAPTALLSYGSVDPFNPPYAADDVVSIGAGGQLTLGFNTPIQNRPQNPWGLDLVIFGNEGFYDTNWPAGMTDGRVFAQVFGAGSTSRVLASADNVSFFELRPPAGTAARLDGLFPTDSAGQAGLPVNPWLNSADFAGRDLTGIRQLYQGSGGGVGFDLAWAVDGLGQSVTLPAASYVRVEVSAGKVEVDGMAAAVPEPSTAMLGLAGLVALGLRRRSQV